MSRELSDTSQVIEKSKVELQGVLKSKWNNLLWEPEIKDQEKTVNGFEVHRFEHSQYAYVEGSGKIILVDEEKSESAELGMQGYLSLAPEAEQKLDELSQEQLQELEGDPDGRDIIWRPGQRRFGRYHSLYGPYSNGLKVKGAIKVRAKKDELYCPDHTDTQLITVARSQGLEKFSDCPKGVCTFSVYSGS